MISTLLSRLDVDANQARKAGRGTAHLVAKATWLGAVLTSLDDSWVQLTPESLLRLVGLAKFNLSQDGVFSRVMRGAEGQIDSFAQFNAGA